MGWIRHVKNEAMFQDRDDELYVVLDEAMESRLEELYVYRKQQVSNQVRLSLDIVTPTKSKKLEANHQSMMCLLDEDEDHDSDEILVDYRHSSMDVSTELYVKYESTESPETY